MRTIKAFNLSPLHVEEDFGFLKQFHDEAVTLRGGSGGDSESPDEIADEVNPVLDGQISAFYVFIYKKKADLDAKIIQTCFKVAF